MKIVKVEPGFPRRSSLGPIAAILAALVFGVAACSDDSNVAAPGVSDGECSVPTSRLVSGGVAKDGIPALTDPVFVAPEQATYLTDDSRVIGIRTGDEFLAIPHNILWHHEIVNLNREGLYGIDQQAQDKNR